MAILLWCAAIAWSLICYCICALFTGDRPWWRMFGRTEVVLAPVLWPIYFAVAVLAAIGGEVT